MDGLADVHDGVVEDGLKEIGNVGRFTDVLEKGWRDGLIALASRDDHGSIVGDVSICTELGVEKGGVYVAP